MQTLDQAHKQPKRGNHNPPANGFKPGWSGNPSGKTRTMRRTEELIDQFKRVHRCEPTAADLVTLRACGKLAAKLEGRGLGPIEMARLANTLRRDLRKLHLDRTRAPRHFDDDISAADLRRRK